MDGISFEGLFLEIVVIQMLLVFRFTLVYQP